MGMHPATSFGISPSHRRRCTNALVARGNGAFDGGSLPKPSQNMSHTRPIIRILGHKIDLP